MPVQSAYRFVSPYLNGKRVLDLRCGAGPYLANFEKGSVGIDANMAALFICRDRGLNTVAADLNRGVCFRDASFEVVFCYDILEHVESPIGLLRECHRVLKDQGLLVVGLPVEGSLVRVVGDHYFRNHSGHIYSFSLDNLQVLLGKTGFTLERVILDPPLVDTLRLGFLLAIFQWLPTRLGMWFSTAYWALARKG